MSEAYIPPKGAPNVHGLAKSNDRVTPPIPENDTEALEQMLSDPCDELNMVIAERAAAIARAEASEALVAQMREALQWYGDKANWQTPMHQSGYGTVTSNAANDSGNRARASLSLTKTEERSKALSDLAEIDADLLGKERGE